MKSDMDERIIKDALNEIQTPQYDIFLEVKKQIQSSKSPMLFKKKKWIPLLVCLSLLFSLAMASDIPAFNRLLSIVSSDIALILQPIVKSCEDQGIKMEVIAAMNDDEMAVVYITIQDLVGDRIDENLDIYDYKLSEGIMFNYQIVHYDEITKTATLRIQMNEGKKLDRKNISFEIDSFLSHKKNFDVDTNIDFSSIKEVQDSQKILLNMNNINGGGGNLYPELKDKGNIHVLKPDVMDIRLPNIDFTKISNIGYINNRLHIQVKWIKDSIDDHGYFYFVDALENTDINKNINSGSLSFGLDSLGNTVYGKEYQEYIFDVSDINLSDVKLKGSFITAENFIKGKWKTKFKLQSIEKEKQIKCNVELDIWKLHHISVSPLGITLTGSGKKDNLGKIVLGDYLEKIVFYATMIDGSTKTFDSIDAHTDDKEVSLKFSSLKPLDVSLIQSITINGIVIELHE